MTTRAHPPLSSFVDFVRATDPHAARHLPLLEESVRHLARRNDALSVGNEERAARAAAARLERWRYQLLNRGRRRLAVEDRQLADVLDLAANDLAGRPPRAPRSTRLAMEGTSPNDPALAEAQRALDPGVSLEVVTAQAATLTREHFGTSPLSRLGGGGEGFSRSGRGVGPEGAVAGRECKMRIADCKLQIGGASGRWRMLLYAPVYLSNYCVNYCRYCGFRHPHVIQRRHLSPDEALREAELLCGRGFRHLLLVAGDFPSFTTPEYFAGILAALRSRGIAAAVEIAPQSTEAYETLAAAGAIGVTLYQETYDEDLYREYHPRGTKASYDWRLEGLDRAAEAGMTRLGLGVLLGLADPRKDLAALMRHGRYLRERFPGRPLAFSLPRIHDAPEGFRVRFPVDDELFVRMYCALRIAFPEAEQVLSTREPEVLRNRLATICITQMSAGSCTAPGGYEEANNLGVNASDDSRAIARRAGEQFPVCDRRPPVEVAAWLRDAGFEVAWEIAEGRETESGGS